MEVLIAVINWNGGDHVLNCLQSLKRLDYPRDRLKIIVIDNASSDGSPEAISRLYPDYSLKRNSENLGWSMAANQAAELSLRHRAKFLWLLNNDVVLEQGSLNNLIRAAESDKNIAVLSPAVYSFDIPEKEDNLGYRVNLWTGRFKALRSGREIFRNPEESVADVDTVQGCAALIRTSVFSRIGRFRARYEAYFEESDFHLSVRKNGYRVVTVKTARIRHEKAASYNQKIFRRAYLLLRNLFLFEVRNAEPIQLAVFIPYFFLVHLPFFVFRGSVYVLSQKVRKNN